MSKKLLLTIAPVTVAIIVLGVSVAWRHVRRNVDYFPLSPKSNWTYRVISKSQRSQYVVVDSVVGVKYVAALKLTGVVVDEFYNMDRGGTRPVVYYAKDGYLTRFSGLDYDHGSIQAPAWGRSQDADFLPLPLLPNAFWTNADLPFGHFSGAFELAQGHHSFPEPADVLTPAGRFSRCIRIETRTEYRGGSYKKYQKNLALFYTDWYAPNVGLVKTVAQEDGLGGAEIEHVELIRYNIGAEP